MSYLRKLIQPLSREKSIPFFFLINARHFYYDFKIFFHIYFFFINPKTTKILKTIPILLFASNYCVVCG
jgi:hypothetical protein